MQSTLMISRSGMAAAMAGMQVAARNIANTGVGGFERQRAEAVTSAAGGVDIRVGRAGGPGDRIEADLVGLLQAKNSFLANLTLFRRADEALASLIDDLV